MFRRRLVPTFPLPIRRRRRLKIPEIFLCRRSPIRIFPTRLIRELSR
jgi:hypothetical protein